MQKTTIENLRPLLRWAGSKRKLLNELVMCVPTTFQRYYEPFLGSACLYLAIQPKRAVLGDFNGDLVNFYETIALHSREVDEQIQAMPKTPEFYYQIRSLPTEDVSQITLAARFLYLNRYCFNGIYRVNKTGRFNVPRGKQTGRIPTGAEIDKVGELIRSAEIRHADFEDCVKDVQAGDFVYFDPPYASVTRSGGGEYGYGAFGKDDLDRFVRVVNEVDSLGASVLISYGYDEALVDNLGNWHMATLNVKRSVAGYKHRRQTAKELLISNRQLPVLAEFSKVNVRQ